MANPYRYFTRMEATNQLTGRRDTFTTITNADVCGCQISFIVLHENALEAMRKELGLHYRSAEATVTALTPLNPCNHNHKPAPEPAGGGER